MFVNLRCPQNISLPCCYSHFLSGHSAVKPYNYTVKTQIGYWIMDPVFFPLFPRGLYKNKQIVFRSPRIVFPRL